MSNILSEIPEQIIKTNTKKEKLLLWIIKILILSISSVIVITTVWTTFKIKFEYIENSLNENTKSLVILKKDFEYNMIYINQKIDNINSRIDYIHDRVDKLTYSKVNGN